MQKSRVTNTSFFDVEKVRSDFPILQREVHGKRLVYLDNAATTQKPKQVIDSISNYYLSYNSNIHRSVHTLAEEATEAFEKSRNKVANFLGSGESEVIFTKNATEALNLAAFSTSALSLKENDKIVVTEMEHHSNFVPWQRIAELRKARLEIVRVDDEGIIDESDLESKLTGAKIFAFTQMSNVLGTITDTNRLTKIAHEKGAIVVVDGAQSAPHMKVDMNEMDCDFFAVSAHKMLGPTGVGCLYGRKKLLEEMPPFLLGGDMIHSVHRDKTEWNELPWKFEAGTSNIADVIAFGVAIDYLKKIGMENIMAHERALTECCLEALQKIEGLKLYGPTDPAKRGCVFSFNFGNIHAHDIASILDDQGVAIRSGHHCAQILMEKLNVPATSRASFYIYNGLDDIDALCSGLEHVKEVLG